MASVNIQTITPLVAAELLSTAAYEHERTLRAQWVKYLAEEMKRGSFKQDTVIEIVKRGDTKKSVLVDGYHRLNAVIQSNLSCRFVVIESEVKDADEIARMYYRIDRGLPRTTADQMRVLGIEKEFDLKPYQIRRLSAAVPWIDSGWKSSGLMHPDDRERLVREYAEECGLYFVSIAGRLTEMKSAFERAATLSVGLVTLKYSVERYGTKVEEFWEGVAMDNELASTDARKWAFRHLLTTGMSGGEPSEGKETRTPRYSSRYLAACFNAYVAGRGMKQKPKIHTYEPMVILGSPFSVNGK